MAWGGENEPLVGQGNRVRKLLALGVVCSVALAVVAISSLAPGPSSLYQVVPMLAEEGGLAEVLPDHQPLGSTFEWNEENVDAFKRGCAENNQDACNTLATSDEALKILNKWCWNPSCPLSPAPLFPHETSLFLPAIEAVTACGLAIPDRCVFPLPTPQERHAPGANLHSVDVG